MLNLSQNHMERVKSIYKLIKEHIPHAELYLFGSYAKRKIKPSSDLDILVLIDDDLDKMTIRKTKWQLEEYIEELVQFTYEVDLKLYTKQHFMQSKETLGFESEIASYMILLEDKLWR